MEINSKLMASGNLNASAMQTASNTSKKLADKTTSVNTDLQLSSTSQALIQEFQQAVKWLQQEALEPFQGRGDELGTLSTIIDIGRYNLYLIDKKADELQQRFGSSIDIKEMKSQLIQASGIATENTLNSANRKEQLVQNVAGLLHDQDVQALTDIYIYAKEEGLDTKQVEHLAFFLGVYRHSQRGANSYHPPSQPADAETIKQAQAIFSSKQNPVAKLDSGFLETMLNPNKNLKSFSKLVDLDFLQEITGLGSGGDVFESASYFNSKSQPLAPANQAETLAINEDLHSKLASWLNQHWAQQPVFASQLLGFNLADKKEFWAQLNNIFA